MSLYGFGDILSGKVMSETCKESYSEPQVYSVDTGRDTQLITAHSACEAVENAQYDSDIVFRDYYQRARLDYAERIVQGYGQCYIVKAQRI